MQKNNVSKHTGLLFELKIGLNKDNAIVIDYGGKPVGKIREALKEQIGELELVFLFQKPFAPMPGAKIRKNGTKRTHAEWAETNNFTWYSEETLPKEWITDEL
mgnify:CR=1 FL=1